MTDVVNFVPKPHFNLSLQVLPIPLHRVWSSDRRLPLQRVVHFPRVRRAGPVRLHRRLQRSDHGLQGGRGRGQVRQQSQRSRGQHTDAHVGRGEGMAVLG